MLSFVNMLGSSEREKIKVYFYIKIAMVLVTLQTKRTPIYDLFILDIFKFYFKVFFGHVKRPIVADVGTVYDQYVLILY